MIPLLAFLSLNMASAGLSRFGEIDEGAVVMSIKPKKTGKNAVVPFSQIGAASGVVSSGPSLQEHGM
jgi:DnaJ family protein C protein 17